MTNPYAPPTAPVEDVVIEHAATVLAGRGVRLGASLLDGIIAGALIYIPLLMGLMVSASFYQPEAIEMWIAPATLAVVGLAVWAWLNIKYVRANGQSIAKKILGIKVVRTDGSPASLGRIFWLRNVVNGGLGIVPLYGFIDPLFIFGEQQRCLHDRIADTIVVVA